jgi:hypothetical protein
MRTTVEITEIQRARLLELAARRGEKGFSKLVQAALDAYLEAESSQDDLRGQALAVRGALSDQDVDQLRDATREIRESWR